MDKSYYLLVVILIVAIGLIVAVMLYLLVPLQPAFVPNLSFSEAQPTQNFTIYAGEISNSLYGFGIDQSHLTSPGPTIRLKTAVPVNLTFVNVGKEPHAFQIVNAPRTGASVEFGAVIGSADSPLQSGESASVLFTPNVPGSYFFYICPVGKDVELGMWGTVVVD